MHLDMMTLHIDDKPHPAIIPYNVDRNLPHEDIPALLGGDEMIASLSPVIYVFLVVSYMM